MKREQFSGSVLNIKDKNRRKKGLVSIGGLLQRESVRFKNEQDRTRLKRYPLTFFSMAHTKRARGIGAAMKWRTCVINQFHRSMEA